MRLSITEAAKAMDVDPQFLRLALQQGRFDFGVAVKMKGRFAYYINANRFFGYMEGKDAKQA